MFRLALRFSIRTALGVGRSVRFFRGTALAAGLLLFAQAGLAQQSAKPLTNADVIKMVKNAVPTSIIVSAIQANPTNFDISAEGLIALQKGAVPQRVMDAVVKAESNKRSTGALSTSPDAVAPPSAVPLGAESPAGQTTVAPSTGAPTQQSAPPATPPASSSPQPPAASGQSAVAFQNGGSRQEIAVERTQMAETKTKPTSMASLASDSTLTQFVQVGMNSVVSEAALHSGSVTANAAINQAGSIFTGMLNKRKPMVTYVWALPGPSSANIAPTSSPGFVLNFASLMGVNLNEFEPAMVKLTPSATNAVRLVGATQGKEVATSSSTVDWQVYTGFLEDRVPVRAQRTGSGQYQLSVISPLPPGEYAIVLRPVSRTKKFSGGDVLRDQGDGMMFDSVWSFQVPSGVK